MKIYACFLHRESKGQQHDVAHRLLSLALEREYGIESYTLGKSSHGKPYLEGYDNIKINLSHCSGLAVCAVGEYALGVDCEQLRAVRDGVVRRVCTENEAYDIEHSETPKLTFTRLWTLKESFVKAVGRGISYPMKNAEFSFSGTDIYTNVTGASFRQWVIGGRYVISLCMKPQESEPSLKIFI